MDSVRISSDLPMISRKAALMGAFISRLMIFCLLYFAPALASEPGAPAPELIKVLAQSSAATESLDPKHSKDHDSDRDAVLRSTHQHP